MHPPEPSTLILKPQTLTLCTRRYGFNTRDTGGFQRIRQRIWRPDIRLSHARPFVGVSQQSIFK